MKKIYQLASIICLIVLVPGPAIAITQKELSAEVQILCPEDQETWRKGSGTIIDPEGIILTNRHLIVTEKNQAIKECFIGLTNNIDQEPDFGPAHNPYIAELKYFGSSSEEMDAAILSIRNPGNSAFPSVSVWNYDTALLSLGDTIEIVGYPGIGESTITYVNGIMSGLYKNYIKSSAPLEHGNSGGAAYTHRGEFIGVATAISRGQASSMSFILDINKIKRWLISILGENFQTALHGAK